MTWKKELLDTCRELRKKCGTKVPGAVAMRLIEGTQFTVSVTFQGMRAVARGQYMRPSYSFSLLTSDGGLLMVSDSQETFVCMAASRHFMGKETESQTSKHCDVGYMNDTRFGVEP